MATPRQDPTAAAARSQAPAVQTLSLGDILQVLGAGLRDFRAAPGYGLVVGLACACVGWGLLLLLLYFELPFLVYPLAAGFAFVAPFVVTLLYAVSRALEQGQPPSWRHVLGAVRHAAGRDLGWMALVTGFALFIWMDIAALLFFGFMGLHSFSAPELLRVIFTTPSGLLFLVIGNGVGAVLSVAVFSFSVISFPMLFDRDADFVTAMIVSVQVVLANPLPMLIWCATIAGLIALSLLSGLVALIVVLPVLGHASWHLYRRAVAPAP